MFCCLEAFEPIPGYQGLAHETGKYSVNGILQSSALRSKVPKTLRRTDEGFL